MERPLPTTYWVKPGKFLAGSYPGALHEIQSRYKLQKLLAAGVTRFIDLTEPGEYHEYERLVEREATKLNLRISYNRVPVEDMTPPTPSQMVYILDTIDKAIAADQPVYVHCFAGIGRTGTVVGCWLVRHGLEGHDALDKLIQLRRGMMNDFMESPHRTAQVDMVLDWQIGQ